MAKNTFTLHALGEKKSISLNVIPKRVFNGWWSSESGSTSKLTSAKLGDTVYFNFECEGFGKEDEIELQLFDKDYHYFNSATIVVPLPYFNDWSVPDDSEFAGKEIIKSVNGSENKKKKSIEIKLLLDEAWESMLNDDGSGQAIELYWRATFESKKYLGVFERGVDLPASFNDYLHVNYSDRTLYIKTPIDGYNLPEFRDKEGDSLMFVELALEKVKKGIAKDEKNQFKKAVKKGFENAIDDTIKTIALAKLKKGSLVANTGEVFTNSKALIYKKQSYIADEKTLSTISRRKNFGFIKNGKKVSTKGLDQVKYFSNNGAEVKILKIVKNSWTAFNYAKKALNIFDYVKSDDITDGTGFGIGMFEKFIPKQYLPIMMLVDVAGVLVQEMKAKDDQILEELVQMELDRAKEKGLDAVRNFADSYRYSEEFQWELMPISSETANKLVQGKFRTFRELENFEIDLDFADTSNQLLIRTMENENRGEKIFIIETIFINE